MISFLLTNVSGDAAEARLGIFASTEELEAMRQELGIDRPLATRLGSYTLHAAKGDFGESFRTDRSALGEVLQSLPWTLGLVAVALVGSLCIVIPGAVISVWRNARLEDGAIQGGLMVVQGIPEFWLALMLTWAFSESLGWLPSLGSTGLRSWILPVTALALPLSPPLFRLLRGQLLDVMEMEFMHALRGKGLSERDIVIRHGLRNASGPFVNLLALQIGWLIGGTLIVETLFNWPGIGKLLFDSVGTRDYPVISAVVVVMAFAYVALNVLADLFLLLSDPRIRLPSSNRRAT